MFYKYIYWKVEEMLIDEFDDNGLQLTTAI